MKRLVITCCCLFVIGSGSAWSWWASGHGILTRAAVLALPDEIPDFFRKGKVTIAHCALDPDVSKNRGAGIVRGAEYPEHFLDLELVKGRDLPETRYEYIRLCQEVGELPEKAGFLPYALGEWTERLAVAFAEYRKWPDNPSIQSKCLVYAGFIAHYAQDMCQPLHLTVHYDGRVQPDGSKTHKGIHDKVDSLPDVLKMNPEKLSQGLVIQPLSNLMPGIMKQFNTGFLMVDQVYSLAGKADEQDWEQVPEVIEFGEKRARESVRFTASLYLTAWRLSEEIQLGSWLDREKSDAE